MPRRSDAETTPLFARLPRDAGAALDRAASETGLSKRELVTRLIADHLGPPSPPVPPAAPRDLLLGRHAFRAAEPSEVLTVEQVAELLQVEEAAVLKLADDGELPGRRIDGAWRFARSAVLDWLRG